MLQAATASASTELLAGLVERVTFHNPESGFCVLRIKARGQRDLITVVGHAALISAGEFFQARGSWANDRTHGVQFKAAFLKAMPPTQRNLLYTGVTRGKTARCLGRPAEGARYRGEASTTGKAVVEAG
jgi:hypothetical protein